ncbi:hypothetical protein [Hymenobacter terricola]|uniref:hypothetical protein n=1 Tax=Hymenobacter terricola TaxID=2819236 RepID=UPI001B30B1F9|nr:hypothetical protein [Hymenobacter terricola]
MNSNSTFSLPAGSLGDVAFVTYLYYRQARNVAATAADFSAWLASLPAAARARAEARGPAAARLVPDFKRFLLEARGHRLVDFMASRLAPTVLAYWLALPDEDL